MEDGKSSTYQEEEKHEFENSELKQGQINEGVLNTFTPHFKEIERRANNVENCNSKYFTQTDDGDDDMPFVLEDQKYVLFSLSHEEFAPIPEQKDSPAIRIYGLFPDMESLQEHVKVLQNTDKNCSILADETHKWLVGARAPRYLQDEKYIEVKKEVMLKQYYTTEKKNQEEFNKNVENRTTGENIKEDEEEPVELNNITDKQKVGRKIASSAEVRGQKYAAISIIQDKSHNSEFMIKIYGAFDKEEDINRWITNVVGNNVFDFSVDVINLCEWIYPQQMKSGKAKKEIFRSEELSKIMNNYKSKPEDVKKVLDMAKSNSLDTPLPL